MDACNKINLNVVNHFPVFSQNPSPGVQASAAAPKMEARKDDAQRTALLSSLPEKNQLAITQQAAGEEHFAGISDSAQTTPPSFAESAGSSKDKAQSDFNRPLGFGAGPAIYVQAHMDNMFYPSKSPLEMFQGLLEKSKETNVNRPLSFEKRESYLGVAAQMNQTEIIQFLIEKNASVNYRDNDGKTALDIARENRSFEAMQMLAQYGAE